MNNWRDIIRFKTEIHSKVRVNNYCRKHGHKASNYIISLETPGMILHLSTYQLYLIASPQSVSHHPLLLRLYSSILILLLLVVCESIYKQRQHGKRGVNKWVTMCSTIALCLFSSLWMYILIAPSIILHDQNQPEQSNTHSHTYLFLPPSHTQWLSAFVVGRLTERHINYKKIITAQAGQSAREFANGGGGAHHHPHQKYSNRFIYWSRKWVGILVCSRSQHNNLLRIKKWMTRQAPWQGGRKSESTENWTFSRTESINQSGAQTRVGVFTLPQIYAELFQYIFYMQRDWEWSQLRINRGTWESGGKRMEVGEKDQITSCPLLLPEYRWKTTGKALLAD